MGGSPSKSSQETSATKRNNDGAIERSSNEVSARSVKHGAVDRFGFGNESSIVRSGQDSRSSADGLRDGFLVTTAVIGGATFVAVTVASQFTSYIAAKTRLEYSEMLIPKFQAKIQDMRSKGVPDSSDLLRELELWEKQRDSAVLYMKTHKYIGKIVEMFHLTD